MNILFCAVRVAVRKRYLLPTIVFAFAAYAATAHAVILEPHRAAYQVQLVEPRGQVTSAAGLMTVENARVCEGWSVIATLRMRYQLADGTAPETEVTFSSVESRTLYRFSSVELVNGVTAGQIRGSAVLTERGGDGVVHFQMPERRDDVLPRGTVFPTAHLLEVVTAAERGRDRVGHLMFDATRGQDSPFEVTTLVLSGVRPGDDGPGAGLGALTRRPWWPLRMAFYSQRNRRETPNYEVTSNIQDNGVVRAYLVEDENMALQFTLSAIEPLPQPQC